MAKGINRLKSVLKKLNSFNTKPHHHQRLPSNHHNVRSSFAEDDEFAAISNSSSENLRPVYVGKSRRRYFVGDEIVRHPLFQQLADLGSDDEDGEISVSCEVVLFEHLLWMLENADDQRPESLHELLEFYAC